MEKIKENKQLLIEIAKNGEPKPHLKKHPLGKAYYRYMYKSSRNKCYDPIFRKQIEELRPDWVIKKVDENKNQILEMAKNGENRPRPNKHPLGIYCQHYTTKSSKTSYDPEFVEQLRDLRPDWFENPTLKNKKQLLELAKSGQPKPKGRKNELNLALMQFKCQSSNSYDSDFIKELEKLRPDWFIDSSTDKKSRLIEMARNGESRPNSRSHPLGDNFNSYITKGGSFDPIFDNEIRLLRPDWFVKKVDENKRLLLKFANKGGPRPSHKSHLGSFFNRLRTKGKYSDLVFIEQLKQSAPHWFIDKCIEKKQQLLEIARNGEKRPHSTKHILGKNFGSYICKVSAGYDPEFDKQIRALRPDWFAKKKKEN